MFLCLQLPFSVSCEPSLSISEFKAFNFDISFGSKLATLGVGDTAFTGRARVTRNSTKLQSTLISCAAKARFPRGANHLRLPKNHVPKDFLGGHSMSLKCWTRFSDFHCSRPVCAHRADFSTPLSRRSSFNSLCSLASRHSTMTQLHSTLPCSLVHWQ